MAKEEDVQPGIDEPAPTTLVPDAPCPCGLTASFGECCAKVHRDGAGLGATAEKLMRARYSAYATANNGFLLESWHLDTRPPLIQPDADPNEGITWLGLEILDTEAGSAFDQTGEVEFKARFRRGSEHLELHERSTFVRVDGRWVYVDGTAP